MAHVPHSRQSARTGTDLQAASSAAACSGLWAGYDNGIGMARRSGKLHAKNGQGHKPGCPAILQSASQVLQPPAETWRSLEKNGRKSFCAKMYRQPAPLTPERTPPAKLLPAFWPPAGNHCRRRWRHWCFGAAPQKTHLPISSDGVRPAQIVPARCQQGRLSRQARHEPRRHRAIPGRPR